MGGLKLGAMVCLDSSDWCIRVVNCPMGRAFCALDCRHGTHYVRGGRYLCGVANARRRVATRGVGDLFMVSLPPFARC